MMFLNPGTWVVLGVALVALLGVWQSDRALQRQKGAATAVAKMEKKANANAEKADAAFHYFEANITRRFPAHRRMDRNS